MKIGQNTNAAALLRADVAPRPGVGQSKPARRAANAGKTGDVTSIMGIPEEELTPKVRAAIQMLMEEVDRLRQELSQTRQRIDHLEEEADQDALVPAANRRAFIRELSRMMSIAERYGTPASLLFFDVNNMKAINDGFGHGAGDKALIHVAETLRAQVRDTDIVGRLGGDEFGTLLSHTDEANAKEKAQHLADKIAATEVTFEDHAFNVAVAWGVYTLKGNEEAATALHAADQAMYAFKRNATGT